MASLYTIKVVTDFAAAHSLRGYEGPCARVHGHNWKVEALVETQTLDDIGLSIDFGIVKTHLRAICARLDHYNLNDIPPFTEINPTAENLSRYIYEELSALINNDDAKVTAISIWETERAAVTYSEV